MTQDSNKTLFLDLETTGVNPQTNMITEIAAEFHVDGKVEDRFYVQLKAIPTPDKSISLGALKVTQQTLKDTMTKGVEEGEGLINFVDWLLGLDTSCMNICGHNVNFDIGFLKALLTKYNITDWDSVVSYRVEDTCSLARTMMKSGLLANGKASLGSIANILDIKVAEGEHLHNAATDVDVTARVYYKLLNILVGVNNDNQQR